MAMASVRRSATVFPARSVEYSRHDTGTGLLADGDIKINGVSIGAVGGQHRRHGDARHCTTIVRHVTGVTATNNAGVLTLTSKNGTDITLELTAAAATNTG
jgi:hypothetical protein